jgi:hypothetical protein
MVADEVRELGRPGHAIGLGVRHVRLTRVAVKSVASR